MTEERITETETPDGRTHTHTTVVTNEPRRGGGATWPILLVVLIAVIAGIWIFSQIGGAEAAKDNAIAGAANEVGDAAQQVGNAAQDAADNLSTGE